MARRFGSKAALVVGTAVTSLCFAWLAVAHGHPYDFLIASTLLGIGIGLAFSALGNLIVQPVPPTQTGVASGMNTVMRTLGGALGGQLTATLIADNTSSNGLPTVTGFTDSFVLATVFLIVGVVAAALVPGRQARTASLELDGQLATTADPDRDREPPAPSPFTPAGR